jgi:hypothetical protein
MKNKKEEYVFQLMKKRNGKIVANEEYNIEAVVGTIMSVPIVVIKETIPLFKRVFKFKSLVRRQQKEQERLLSEWSQSCIKTFVKLADEDEKPKKGK